MTVLCLLPSFPPLPRLALCLLVLCPCLFQHPSSSVFCSFYLFFPPSARYASSPGDGCPRHLCSVSQMSHNRNWNINLAVDMAEKWWGGGRCACLVVLKGAESITKYWTLQHLVKWWQPSSWGKGRIKPLWPITAVLFTGSTLTLFHSNNTTKSILWFLVWTIGAKGMYESYSEDGRKGRLCLFVLVSG